MLGKLFYLAKNCKNAQVSVDSVVSGHVALVYPTKPYFLVVRNIGCWCSYCSLKHIGWVNTMKAVTF